MPRDFLPAVYKSDGIEQLYAPDGSMLYNCLPIYREKNVIASHPRPDSNASAVTPTYTPSSSSDRGRGVFTIGNEFSLHLDDDTYYYEGGSQDLTATSSPGYAGNTGFNEEYTASFIQHKISGVENTIIVNAGHTSTNASAKHGNVWYVANGTTAPASISDADMPGNNGVSLTRGGASLDGYFFVCDIAGQIHNSDLNDITAWTSTNFLTAERSPDIGIYIGRHHDHIVYIGSRSIEFFYNAGNATGSPLSRRQDIQYAVGCVYPNTIIESGDSITFVGTNQEGRLKVYQLKNFQLTVISTPYIDGLMQNSVMGVYTDQLALLPDSVDTLYDGVYGCEVSMGHNFGYALTGNTVFTQFYDYATGLWCSLSLNATPTYKGALTTWVSIFPIVSSNKKTARTGTSPIAQLANGQLIRFTDGSHLAIDDFGLGNTPDIITNFGKWDAGTDKKKRINSIRLLVDNAANNAWDAITGEIKWTKYDAQDVSTLKKAPDDDYASSRTLYLNRRGQKIVRVGTGRSFRFILKWLIGSGKISSVIGLEIEYDIVE